MANKYKKGVFHPKNPKKLIGDTFPIYRSSWECKLMQYLDENKNVISWSSEQIRIPYINPLNGKKSIYIPDFLVKFVDGKGKEQLVLIEVKPMKEALLESAKTARDRLVLSKNMAKWSAATIWCKQNGVKFQILTEAQLFPTMRK